MQSIRDSYIPLWERNKRPIPLDCLKELYSLSNENYEKIKRQIIKLKRRKGNCPLKFNKRFINAILNQHEKDIKFVKKFHGVRLTKHDIRRFEEFVKAIKLKIKGSSVSKISKLLNLPKSRIGNWVYKGSLPKLAELLRHFIELGDPGNNLQWLSINRSAWRLKGPWIKVPKKIKEYSDVLNVIQQLRPLPKAYDEFKKFNISFEGKEKEKLFGYLLGILVGDCCKDRSHKSKEFSKRIVLELAKTHKSNLRLGDFVTLCANSLGLRMKREKDRSRLLKGRKRKYHFFLWKSQLSPLIDWMMKVCLGLEEGQTTTYTPINAKWILKTPKYFRISFIQGIFDSDGWIDLNYHQVGVTSGPNTELIKKLLKTLNINSKESKHPKNPTSLLIKLNDAFSLPVFNPTVRSYRYNRLNKIKKAQRFKKWPQWLSNRVNNYITSGLKNSEIIERILNEYSVVITGQTIRHKRGVLNKK